MSVRRETSGIVIRFQHSTAKLAHSRQGRILGRKEGSGRASSPRDVQRRGPAST
jgi:hypothetical protein